MGLTVMRLQAARDGGAVAPEGRRGGAGAVTIPWRTEGDVVKTLTRNGRKGRFRAHRSVLARR
jgi:hypothetical protein